MLRVARSLSVRTDYVLCLGCRWSLSGRQVDDGTAHLPEAVAVALVGSDRRSTPGGPVSPVNDGPSCLTERDGGVSSVLG